MYCLMYVLPCEFLYYCYFLIFMCVTVLKFKVIYYII